MFLYPGSHDNAGLKYNPFKAIVSPRPIGWITSHSIDKSLNLAPYSFFNAICEQPAMVMFSSSPKKETLSEKDSLLNILETEEFVVNIVSYSLRNEMNISAGNYPRGVSEIEKAGLKIAESKTVSVPRIESAPAALECRLWDTIELPTQNDSSRTTVIVGTVTGIHINEQFLKDGKIDVSQYQPIARLGYMDYAFIKETFSMKRPS